MEDGKTFRRQGINERLLQNNNRIIVIYKYPSSVIDLADERSPPSG